MLTKGPKTKHERRRQTGFAKRWGRETPPELPELMKPDSTGYMPLYCAAQWIATRGGTLEINPLGEGLWREAFKDLLDRIASEDVRVIGVRVPKRVRMMPWPSQMQALRDGITDEPEHISGIHFASCSVRHPFSDALILSGEICLVSCPYLDDEHWRRGFNDSLQDRRSVRWHRLMVFKPDIARWWPFVSINANATLTQADATLSASASTQPQPALAVTNGPPTQTPAAQPTQPRERTPRKRPLRERARSALDELHPNGVPDQVSVSDAELVSAVNALIKKRGQKGLARDTILRAAGRRK
jgi:hypothetical protein